ncbi:MAG: hypothetical protein EBS08_00515 [Cytophagia bacterium]|nr:hypothetical protein [Cytophagia bacterium]
MNASGPGVPRDARSFCKREPFQRQAAWHAGFLGEPRLGYREHGGDLKGIGQHLDYLQDLGVTALWLNPVLENNVAKESYHGYAATDLYRVDARLGNNLEYRDLVRTCASKGIKVIMDVVHNPTTGRRPNWTLMPRRKIVT